MSKVAQETLRALMDAGGSSAQKLLAANMDPAVLRSNRLLRKDEWIALDEAIVRVTETRLRAIADLRSAGLVRPLGGLGTLLDQFEKVSNVDPAEQSMSGTTRATKDLPEYSLASVPIPITFKDFDINIRMLEASRNRGAPADTVAGEMSARRVAEKLDDMVFNGSSVVVDGNNVYGYTTHPDRITGNLSDGWQDGGTEDPLQDVLDIITALEAKDYYGPFVVYVPVDYNAKLREDQKAESDKTLRQRILEIDAIQDIRSTSDLSDEVVVIQMTRDVVDLSVAQDIVTVEWDHMGGLVQSFKVMAAMAPRVKDTAEDDCGVAHYSAP